MFDSRNRIVRAALVSCAVAAAATAVAAQAQAKQPRIAARPHSVMVREPGKMPTERTCYIGELVNGEDTGSLVGAAKITVTYP